MDDAPRDGPGDLRGVRPKAELETPRSRTVAAHWSSAREAPRSANCVFLLMPRRWVLRSLVVTKPDCSGTLPQPVRRTRMHHSSFDTFTAAVSRPGSRRTATRLLGSLVALPLIGSSIAEAKKKKK